MKQKEELKTTKKTINRLVGWIRRKYPRELPGDVLLVLEALGGVCTPHEPTINLYPEEEEEETD